MKTKKFAIFSHPRCGSTYLCSLLESHPKILCHYEVFNPLEIVTVKGFIDAAEDMRSFTPQTRDEDPVKFLETLFKYDMGAEAIGFKFFINHSQEAHDLILKDRNISKILLRRSIIHSYVSMLIAEKTKAFTQTEDCNGTQVKVPLNVEGLLDFDRQIGGYFSNIKKVLHDTDQKYLEISYEEHIADRSGLDLIFSFLGIERGDHALTSFTKKQNRGTLEDKVENLETVVSDFMRLCFEKDGVIKRYEDTIDPLTREKEELNERYGQAREELKFEKKLSLNKDLIVKRYKEEIDSLKSQREEILNSWSWKITAPLRWLTKSFLR